MSTEHERGLFIAGGLCAILWPILSELVFFAATSALARGAMLDVPAGPGAYAIRLAKLGQQPAILALEWGRVAAQLLLWPFLLAVYRLLSRRGERDLTLVAVGLGLVAMVVMVLSQTLNPTLSHALGQSYVDAKSDAEGAAILATLNGWMQWHRGLNQTACLLYQGCVGLISLGLIRSRTWRARGWMGLVGALLAIPAKIPLGLSVPSNIIWTGLAYMIWPIAMGIGLLKEQ